jgi:hypothetical protein
MKDEKSMDKYTTSVNVGTHQKSLVILGKILNSEFSGIWRSIRHSGINCKFSVATNILDAFFGRSNRQTRETNENV